MKSVSTLEVILEDIAKILTVGAEPTPITTYLGSQLQLVNLYRQAILPKLQELMRKVSGGDQLTHSETKKRPNIHFSNEKLDLYQCVILQFSRNCSKEEKANLLDRFESNREGLDFTRADCLQRILESARVCEDYQKAKRELLIVRDEFRDYIGLNIEDSRSLSENIRQVKAYLQRTKAEETCKLASFDELTSISLLLNHCLEHISKGTPIPACEPLLSNIQVPTVSTPLAHLIELLNREPLTKPALSEADIQKYYANEQLMEVFPQVIHSIARFLGDGQVEPERVDQGKLNDFAKRFERKISNLQEQQRNLHSQIAAISKTSQEYQIQLAASLEKIKSLQAEAKKLKSELDLHQTFNVFVQQELTEKNEAINQLKSRQEQQQSNARTDLHQADVTVLTAQLQEYRQKYQQLTVERSELMTQKLSLNNQLEDERASYQDRLKQEIERQAKALHADKQKDLDRVEERRRADKTKLMKEFDELQEELERYKEKYYTDIGAKLNRSRIDMSICRSEKGVGSSLLEEDFLNDLEEAHSEDHIDIGELQNEFRKQFEAEILKVNKKNGELEEEVKGKSMEIEQLTMQLKEEREQRQLLTSKLEETAEKVAELSNEVTFYKKRTAELVSSNRAYEESLQQDSKWKPKAESQSYMPKFIPYERMLLQGIIFEEDEEGKAVLLRHICDYAGDSVLRTRLLFQYNPSNKTNFHAYIDNRPGLLCLVKTHRAVVAGFYSGALADSRVMNEGGLLISVSNNRSYPLQRRNENSKVNYRGMTYDAYYVVYGNAEMRIRTGENRIFSNFGIQNGYFDYAGSSRQVDEFLGEGDSREVEFEACEFYQLFFEGAPHTANSGSIYKTY